jgi:DNA-3-methyladenine glycosylase
MKQLDLNKLLDVRSAAKYLLGAIIVRTLDDGTIITAKIVETEAYHQDDPASHTYRGQTKRNEAMFGPAGHAYIYFTYGVHWCFNVTAGKAGGGAGILIRAAEPLEGKEVMRKLRGIDNNSQLTNGPAKLAKALKIDKALYGHDLAKPPLQVFEAEDTNFEIIETTRIGISQAVHEIARFYIKDNPYISKP